MEQKPLLSIALLASNRKDTIRKCLDSLTPIRQAIPSELIILDTGCDAEVRAILEEYADIIDDFTWIQDFSAARNATLKHALGEWYMYLDDDEWFVDTEELIEFFRSGEYRDYGYAMYIQRNYLDMQKNQYTDAWVSRMVKRTPKLQFKSKIHEYMEPICGSCKGLRSYVDHYGYIYETREALEKHYERNSTLLKEMIENEPTNLRWRIHLAQEYRSMRMWHELYDLGTQCIALTKGRDEMYTNIYLGCFYASQIIAMREQGLEAWHAANDRGMQQTVGVLLHTDVRYYYEEGIRLCEKALKDERNTEFFHAFCALRLTWFHYWLGHFDEAERCAHEYFKWLAFFEENEPLLLLQKSSPIVADAFDEVFKKEIYSELICIGLKRGSTEYLRKYFDKLEWNQRHLYVFEDIIPVMIDAIEYIEANETNEQIFAKVFDAIQGHHALCEYYNEEVKKAEMRKLAKQIKEQIRMLMNNGMYEQAKAVISQVKEMLPEDAELMELERYFQE